MITTDCITACPLDCYDACRIVVEKDGKLKGDKTHPITRGYLCPNLNHYHDYSRISAPTLRGVEISMEEALAVLIEKIGASKSDRVLYYRGSGNVGLMQRSMEHFFSGFKAVGTSGSLCDGAGEAGVNAGRGSNEIVTPQMVSESEVVIFWGRNPHTTHSHLLAFCEGKTLIVIDPIKTAMAKKADLHIQIKPHGDLQLALLLSRFAIIEGLHDTEFLEEHAPHYNDYYELTQSVRIKATLESIDVSLGEIGAVLDAVRGKRTVIFVGVGVQKYRNGAEVIRAIDGFGALLGLFGKRGCGVSYVGSSLKEIKLPFASISNTVAKPTVDFSKYNCVFIQGANPLMQMPDTNRVSRSFKEAGFTIYFGLHENATSRSADLVIPAKTFLEKNDFRSSYGDYTFQEMAKITESAIGISEYELARRLCDSFGVAFESEEYYLNFFRNQIEVDEGVGYRFNRPDIPYADGFENGEFEFLDEIDLVFENNEDFYLITPKYPKSLNSQFTAPEGVYLHPEAGFEEGGVVLLSSHTGNTEMRVKYDERLRSDCVLIYSGTPNVNVLTPSYLSYEGQSATYQENKIKVTKK